ncbi:MAG: HAMP domain-containing sensor histidine kinase [Bacteroidota bacterium]
MQHQTSSYLVVASAIAMAALLVVQVLWLRHSQSLLEEQFTTNVNTALCSAVATLAQEEECSQPFQQSCTITAAECGQKLDQLIKTERFAKTVSSSLAGFNINLPYEAKVCTKPPSYTPLADSILPPYSCSLDPITNTDSHFLNLKFAEKKKYTLNKMGVMTGTSFGILILICLLFFYASYRLLRQQRMSDLNREFFNHMAHEFRTPLTNIKLASSLLQRKALAPAGHPHLKIIQNEASQLMQQVEQVLYLARLEKNDYLLNKEDHEISTLCRETIAEMRLQMEAKQADVHFQSTHTSTHMRVDQLHLKNALRNLLDNALKYSHNGVKINVELKEYEDHVLLAVQDDGPGLSPQRQQQIFAPFYRQQSSQSCKGFGLGLAYVKRIVDLHQGQIRVFSQPGQGACFEMTLPKN